MSSSPPSHIILPVTHLPSATSFYAAVLQPLGFRYLNHNSNRQVGFGVDGNAEFFLTPAPHGQRAPRQYIVFHTSSRSEVQAAYAAAIRAQGIPRGVPGPLHADCRCYHATIQDHDGHRIEVVYREDYCHRGKDERIRTWRDSVPEECEVRSLARSYADIAPRTRVAARDEKDSSSTAKGLLGVTVAAVAGAAIMYSLASTERRNARDERAFAASRREERPRSTAHTIETLPLSQPPQDRPKPFTLEAGPIAQARYRHEYDRARGIVRTTTEYVYLPASSSPSSRRRPSDEEITPVKRAVTLPAPPAPLMLEDGRESAASRRHSSSHHSTRSHRGERRSSRHDSAVSPRSQNEDSKASTMKPSRRDSILDQAASRSSHWPADVPLPPSLSGYSRTSARHEPARVALPDSHTSISLSQGHQRSMAAEKTRILEAQTSTRVVEEVEEEDDNITLAELRPGDSISCVDFDTLQHRHPSHGSHHRSHRHRSASEAVPSRPSRYGTERKRSAVDGYARTLPIRSREERRSVRGAA